MFRRMLCAALLLFVVGPAPAQGILGDVFSGKLINPEVGAWAWYELTDKATGAKFFLRQAIVGEADVKRKTGYWVETELAPAEGFPTVFKMLLTGPASDPKNIHELIVKEGTNPAMSVPVPQEGYESNNAGARTLVSEEKIAIGSGEEVAAQHYSVGSGEGLAEVWVNDAVRPMGIVKMVSAEGELLLQRYGMGGKDAESVINAYAREASDADAGKVRVEVRVNGEKNDDASGKASKKAAPDQGKPESKPKASKQAKPKE